jgi:hypothetical protein
VEKPSLPSTAPNAFETAATAPELAVFGPAQNIHLEPVVPVVIDDIDLADEIDEEGAPSRQELLARAATLGPPRMTFLSMQLSSSDPILGEKMKPRVVERRARLRRFVKVALGACVAFCLVATAATALSSSGGGSAVAARTATTAVVVPVEKLETPTHVRAPGHMTAAARATPAWRAKRK